MYSHTMIELRDLPDTCALSAIADGEFPSSVLGAGHVAVIMTQNWCPDWLWMRVWLKRLAATDQPAEFDVKTYVLTYNRKAYSTEFMHHKEQVFGNSLIPYVRYYTAGTLVGESNQVRPKQFFSHFR